MFDDIMGARHLPFFTELAGLEDGDSVWRSVSAGLVVLRLVDAWIEEGAAAWRRTAGACGRWKRRSRRCRPASRRARCCESVVDALKSRRPETCIRSRRG